MLAFRKQRWVSSSFYCCYLSLSCKRKREIERRNVVKDEVFREGFIKERGKDKNEKETTMAGST